MNGAAGATPFDVLVAKQTITDDQVTLATQRIARKATSPAEAAMFLDQLRPEAYEPPTVDQAGRAARPRWGEL